MVKSAHHTDEVLAGDIKQIMDLVKPQPDQSMQRQFDILAAADMIEKMPGYVSPTVERRLLLDVVAKLAAVQAALDALPQYTGLIAIDALPVSYGLRNDALPVITDIAKRATKMADKITAKRRNGASPKRYTIAQQKRIAAEHAVYLLGSSDEEANEGGQMTWPLCCSNGDGPGIDRTGFRKSVC